MNAADLLSGLATAAGVLFYCAGTLGLLRFPDVYTRLHALTKADNAGLGLIVTGLAVSAETWGDALVLLSIWLVVMLSGASSAHAVARAALRAGVTPWRDPAA